MVIYYLVKPVIVLHSCHLYDFTLFNYNRDFFSTRYEKKRILENAVLGNRNNCNRMIIARSMMILYTYIWDVKHMTTVITDIVRLGLGWSITLTVCISRTRHTIGWATWTAGSRTRTTGWRTTSRRSRRPWRTCTRTWPSRCSTARWSRSPWPEAASKWAPQSCQVRRTLIFF